MSVQKIIQESVDKNPLGLKEALQEELRNRIALALEAKANESKDEEDEDTEELDEISKSTLGRYINKAAANKGMHDRTFGRTGDKDSKEKSVRRAGGITMAAGKLSGAPYASVHAKESFDLSDFTVEELEDFMMSEDFEQLDEISKKTLASYVSKAADNAAMHGIKYGEKKAQSDEMDRMMNRHMSYGDKDKVRQIMKTTSSDVDAPREKAAKRLKGIDLAVKKLSK